MDAGRRYFHEGVTTRRAPALAVALLLLDGCAGGGVGTVGPVQVRAINGWSLSIDNDQHSRVWTFNGLQGCMSEAAPDLQFSGARLTGGKGAVSVRAGLDVTGKVSADVEPRPLRDGLVPLDQVSGTGVPVTGCPEPAAPLKFSFEVTSDQEWSADGFEVDYRTAGVTRTLQWNLPVTACSPAGC